MRLCVYECVCARCTYWTLAHAPHIIIRRVFFHNYALALSHCIQHEQLSHFLGSEIWIFLRLICLRLRIIIRAIISARRRLVDLLCDSALEMECCLASSQSVGRWVSARVQPIYRPFINGRYEEIYFPDRERPKKEKHARQKAASSPASNCWIL